MPESVEGLSETWVMYRFKAEIGRKYAKDIVARKPLRIIRTLDPSALELSHAMVSSSLPELKIDLILTNSIVGRQHLAQQDRILYQHSDQSRCFWHIYSRRLQIDSFAKGPPDWTNYVTAYREP